MNGILINQVPEITKENILTVFPPEEIKEAIGFQETIDQEIDTVNGKITTLSNDIILVDTEDLSFTAPSN